MCSLNLCFTINCVVEDETSVAPVIHHHLNLHLTQHNLEYTSNPHNAWLSSGLSSTSGSAPDLPWTYLTMSKGQCSSTYGAKLQACNTNPNLVTHALLYSNASKLCQPGISYSGYKLVYISMIVSSLSDNLRLIWKVPTSAVITGPLCGVEIHHFCLALQGWSGHHTINVVESEDDNIDCESLRCVLTEPSTEVPGMNMSSHRLRLLNWFLLHCWPRFPFLQTQQLMLHRHFLTFAWAGVNLHKGFLFVKMVNKSLHAEEWLSEIVTPQQSILGISLLLCMSIIFIQTTSAYAYI